MNIRIVLGLLMLCLLGLGLVAPERELSPEHFFGQPELIPMPEADLLPPLAWECSTTKKNTLTFKMRFSQSSVMVIDWAGNKKAYKTGASPTTWYTFSDDLQATDPTKSVKIYACADHITSLLFPGGDTISYLDIESLSQVDYVSVAYNDVANTQDLRALSELSSCNMHFNEISGLYLDNLENLVTVNAYANEISNDQFIQGCTKLDRYVINGNDIDSIYVGALNDLNRFQVNSNVIEDSIDLTQCPNLEYCGAGENYLNVVKVEGLTKLKQLTLSNNSLNKNMDLRGCPALETVNIGDGGIYGNGHTLDTCLLDGLANLEYVDFRLCGNIDHVLDLSAASGLEEVIAFYSGISGLQVYNWGASNSSIWNVLIYQSDVPASDLDDLIDVLDPHVTFPTGKTETLNFNQTTGAGSISTASSDKITNDLTPNGWTVTQ